MFRLEVFVFISIVYITSIHGNRWYRMFYSNHDDPCIDRHQRYQRCIPDFINAAFRKTISVSSTCGSPAKQFCSLKKGCYVCDASQDNNSYPAEYLTDMNNVNNLTCWQSDYMKKGEQISLILSLEKKFELTYISFQFCSENRPDSIAIYKSMDMVR